MVKRRRKLKISIILGVSVFLLLMTAALVMILLGYTPGIYHPFARPSSGEVSPYLTHNLAPDFFTGMQNNQPFEMVFRQEGLNELLAFSVDTLPFGEFTLSSPSVVLSQDSVVLMATAQVKNISSVLSITAKPAIDEDGKLNLNIQSASLGAVPVLGIVRKIGQQAINDYLSGPDEQEFAGIINNILNNEPFEPIITVSKYTMRLKALTLEEGKIRLLLEPVKESSGVSGPRVP